MRFAPRNFTAGLAIALAFGGLTALETSAQVAHPLRLRVLWTRSIDQLYSGGTLADLAVLPDGRLAVLDGGDQRVRILDSEGHLTASFGGQGSGPGEIQRGFDLAVDTDGTMLVADIGTRRIQRWSADGRLIGAVPVDASWHFFSWSPVGVFLRTRPPMLPGEPSDGYWRASMYVRGLDTLPVARSAQFRVEWKEGVEAPIDGEFCWYCAAVPLTRGLMALGLTGPDAKIRLVDRDGRTVRLLTIPGYQAVSYSASEIADAREHWARRMGSNAPAPEFLTRPKPGLSVESMGADASGRLWVRPTVPVGQATRLVAFGSDGKVLFDGSLEVPADRIAVNGRWIALVGEAASTSEQVITLVAIE